MMVKLHTILVFLMVKRLELDLAQRLTLSKVCTIVVYNLFEFQSLLTMIAQLKDYLRQSWV